MKPEEDLLDVLQNIEFAIITEYRADRTILDMDVHDAVNALARHYEAEEEQRTPPRPHLAERSKRIFDAVKQVCEWRLGRAAISATPESENQLPGGVNTVAEIVACLKHIRKSVPFWSKENGRQGYLDFVQGFIR